MSASVGERLRAVEGAYHETVRGSAPGGVGVSARSRVHPRASLEPDPKLDVDRREMLRLARLYADPSLIEDVACETVIARLSEGLAS